jgi:hypothetical protein
MNGFAVACACVCALLAMALPASAQNAAEIAAICAKAKPIAIPAGFLRKQMEAMRALWPELPEHLRRQDAVKEPADMDVQRYFTVLTHVRMEEGYVLDYVYHYDGLGGFPVLYARKKDAPPFAAEKDLNAAPEKKDLTDWMRHVLADGTPEGWLELTLLSKYGNAFYLHWHALAFASGLAYDKKDLEALAKEFVPDGVELDEKAPPPDQKGIDTKKLQAADPDNCVRVGETHAVVDLYTVSEVRGTIARESFAWILKPPYGPPLAKEERLVCSGRNIVF